MPDDLDLLRSLGRESAEPDERSVERARDLLDRRIRQADRAGLGRARWPLRRRSLLLATAVVLLVGSSLGFGIAGFVTPSGSASTTVAGLGFIPAEGWSVRQETAVDQPGVARAIAANIPISSADDDSQALPYATVRALPSTGVVIAARLFPRGDERADAEFPLRKLPLRMADAVQSDLPTALGGTSVFALRVRAGTGGYNVDARLFFGEQPSAATVARAEEQLQRLVVAADGVTLVVLPRLFTNTSQRMTVYGAVSSGKAGEKVTVQFKACGVYPIQYRDALETTTTAGGGYSFAELQPFNLGVSGTFRALSGNDVSAEVPVKQRAGVYLYRHPSGRKYRVSVWGKVSFWRRYVLLQRFDRRRGVWVTVRRVVLTEDLGGTEWFRPGVPKGTQIRVLLPQSQAKPCYVGGPSQVWKT
jgi:hypothetical protein